MSNQDPIPLILQTWSTPTLLPPPLPLPPNPCAALLDALLNLATLTPNQPERAWNLISTYFHARIREASYTGRSKGGVYAVVEEEDVIKACGSVRRMSVGMGMEVGVHRDSTNLEGDSDGGAIGKRKWSIRDEVQNGVNGDGCGSENGDGHEAKKQDTNTTLTFELPPLPSILDMPPHPESRVDLPPIYTLTRRDEHQISLETLIEAARGAMHEKNLRRKEMEDAEEVARLARGRFMEARRLAERLRGGQSP